MIEELPGHAKFLRQMGRERLDSESLGRVVATVEDVDGQFFSKRKRPVRTFAGDQCIDPLIHREFQFSSGTTSHNPNPVALFTPTRQNRHRPAQNSFQLQYECRSRHIGGSGDHTEAVGASADSELGLAIARVRKMLKGDKISVANAE